MSRHNLAWLLGIFSISVFGFFVSLGATAREQDRDYELVRLFVDVLHKVRGQYVHELSPERERKLVEDMLNGGLDRLDPHSGFIGPNDYKQFRRQSKGELFGVGIHLGYDPNGRNELMVISPMPDSPAFEAGIEAGDVIVKIDGKSTDGMRLREAVDLITGEPGKKVTLSVRQESGKVRDVTMVRAKIDIPSVLGDQRKQGNLKEWDFLIDKKDKIGYVRLVGFNEKSTGELRAALKQLKKEGMRALVLDLRGNPGGLLSAAKEISNLFLSEGRIVSTKGRNQEEEVYDADPRETMLGPESEVPMAVLIDHYSASASEIVSAALQDHKRAVIVGERSYGKGSVQNIIEMERGQSALKLTTAKYLRPSRKNIHRFRDEKEFEAEHIDADEWGVKPNAGLEVSQTQKDRRDYVRWRNDRDIIRDKKPAPKKNAKDAEKKPFVDKVLDKALEHLRGELKKSARAPA
jgi:carboxyl-terminal processing protease